jgi:uncharacterized membrane protein YdjX (TVP38/TMEM64 family)
MNICKRFGESVINGQERNKRVSVFLYDWFPDNQVIAALISISLNILIAITGVLPSAFITLGTVGILGLNAGILVLIIGEAAGAIVSFILYRKGIHKLASSPKFNKIQNKYLQKLSNTDAISAFFIVILLRLLPFVPSGAVTLTAALSNMRLLSFSIASTLGKIPALFIEAYSAFHILNLKPEWQLGLFLLVVIIFLFYLLWKKFHKQDKT